MKVYSDKLTMQDLDSIADDMGIMIYDANESATPRVRGKFKGKCELGFLLRPVTDDYRRARNDPYTKSGIRRIWAVSWAGHYVFMRAVFNVDPQASIVTSVQEYHGEDDFSRLAFGTGERNVGSLAAPQSFEEQQDKGHVEWFTEANLIQLASTVGPAQQQKAGANA